MTAGRTLGPGATGRLRGRGRGAGPPPGDPGIADTAARRKEGLPVLVFDGEGFVERRERLIREIPLTLYLDGRRVITIACAGLHVEELAVGFLRSEGFLATRGEIASLEVSSDAREVRVGRVAGCDVPLPETVERTLASSGARGFGQPGGGFPAGRPSTVSLSAGAIFALMDRFLAEARLHEETGGTHAAALVRNGEILAVREDIGRHNTIDMLGGHALLGGIDCREAVILRTGRVSSEIVHKIRQLGVPLVCSLSVPTAQAVEMAREAGMTLVGSIRHGRMKIYTHGKERVTM